MFENSSLTSIDMSNFIMSVSSFMFKGSALTSINLPLATGINIEGFRNCSNLTEATLSIGTSLGQNAFRNCTELTTVNIPNVTSIGPSCFDGDAKITTFDIDWTKITYIGDNAFYSSNIPGSIVLSSYNGSLGNWAFYNCKGITSFSAPLISTLPINCLSYSAVTSADLPATTEIKDSAFRNCSSLTTVNIPNVTVLKLYAFENCSNLTTINIDWSAITHFEQHVFGGTSIGQGQTLDITSDYASYPHYAFRETKFKKIIIHLPNWDGSGKDSRYPIASGCSELEYYDLSDTKDTILGSESTPKLVTAIYPSTITQITWNVTSRQANLQHFIMLSESTTPWDNLTTNYHFRQWGSDNNGKDANIYVVNEIVRQAYLAHPKIQNIPNYQTRIKILAELPVGVWTTGLYQQYEPYLSHSNDPAYA